MNHAKLSASAAHRWMECPGSARLSEGLEGKPSEHSAAGTVAHDIASAPATGHDTWPAVGDIVVEDGFKIEVTDEMFDAVREYVANIEEAEKEGYKFDIEVDLTAPLKKVHPDLGGTADAVGWHAKKKSLLVIDFKYGSGVFVGAVDNKQLKMYALGALLKLGKPAKTVTARIVQPRYEHEDGSVREETFAAVELLDFAADVEKAAIACSDPKAPLVPGEAQCKWCPARFKCPALEEKQHALVATEFSDLTPYDPLALKRALEAIPLVKARIKAIDEFAYQEAMSGRLPPEVGHKLVAKRGTRKWISEEAVRSWAEAKAVDPFQDPKMKSPAQLEKELTKEQKKEMDHYVETVSSGLALVPNSDKRPAVHKALVEEFTVIPGTVEEK